MKTEHVPGALSAAADTVVTSAMTVRHGHGGVDVPPLKRVENLDAYKELVDIAQRLRKVVAVLEEPPG